MSEFVEYIGVIARTHGMNGAVVLVDTPGVRLHLTVGSNVAVGFSREFAHAMTITMFEASSQFTRMAFLEAPSAETASPLIDQAVYARASDVAVSDERYSVGDIEGCQVVNEVGNVLGTISEVWLLPANDVWVIECADGSTIPIPVIESVVKNVDVVGKTITIHLLEGLDTLSSSPDDVEEDSE
ncbi:MAG: ribosome maturation factor RimM [bacterium]|nr:ribosome maturation factor RimM [bacterium]